LSENARKTLSMALICTHAMSFWLCFSSVNKTVKKELHVMQNKIIKFNHYIPPLFPIIICVFPVTSREKNHWFAVAYSDMFILGR
jgi:uncharacterized protein with PQ loop repeat